MRLLAAAFAALVFAPTALAAGPTYVTQGWAGVAAAGGIRYVTVPAGASTVLEQIHRQGGRVGMFATLPGRWGIPAPTVGGTGGGLSRDGKLLVLGDDAPQTAALRARSRFALVATKTLEPWTTIELRGDFAFDALSPDAATLFLVQHVGADAGHYVVRAYDLRRFRLLPGRIADVRQRGWTMAGVPTARATSPEGRLVYTLYRRDGGTPFVHVLDTVRRTAVCVGLPWPAARSQDALSGATLRLHDGKLAIATTDRRASPLVLDTATNRFVRPGGAGNAWVAWALAGLAAAAAAALLRRAAAARTSRPRPATT
jgi:hypothetical protein